MDDCIRRCYAMDYLGADFNSGLNPCGYSRTENGVDVCTRRKTYGTVQFPSCGMDKPYSKQVALPTDNTEHCVSCGEVIPEGRQVCPACEEGG